ncbi:MMPL family transporter [Nocardia thailandica]|uniref:MMPL family transporter n=1 Tax=Nocardia thailandica TaxID=257275 RepID=UPI0002DCD6FD|nr:MMPL family transporter [Nocardia thailandica]
MTALDTPPAQGARTGLLGRLTGAAQRAPRLTLLVAALFLVLGGAAGSTLTDELSAGGFVDPAAESSRAAGILVDEFGLTSMQMVFTVTGDDGVLGAATTAAGRRLAEDLRTEAAVAGVLTPWDSGPASAALISTDRRVGALVVSLRGADDEAMNTAHRLAESRSGTHDGITVAAGGPALAYYEVNHTATEDGSRAEMITLPLSMLVLALLLRSVIAAAIPVAAGAVAIGVTVAALAGLSLITEVSVFAVNATGAMGLALSIDYALLIISRFREYLDEGVEHPAAVSLAVGATARAVVFSGLTLTLSLLGAMFFPIAFVRSMSIAGIVVVALAVLLALTCVPAMLVLFGQRIERRRTPAPPVERSRFFRTARFAQRRPVLVSVLIVAGLLALGAPALGMRLGLPDDRVLPRDSAVHQVGDTLREQFPIQLAGTFYLAVPGVTSGDATALADYAAELSRLPGVSAVTGTPGNFLGGARQGTAVPVADGAAYLAVATRFEPNSAQAGDLLDRIHAVATPLPVLVGGLTQQNADLVTAIERGFPRALVWIVVTAFLLLLCMTGSVLLPLKAVALNCLSLSASFGALVWIFQSGHLGGLGTVVTGVTICTIPIVLFASTFGLSMDYEVFLLSRFKQQWEASGRTRADNDLAVAVGTARSGRVITAAALVMVIAFSGLIFSEVAVNRILGLGMTLAIVLDATLLRLLLVPAVMRLAGTWNWWAPAPLRPFLARFEIRH